MQLQRQLMLHTLLGTVGMHSIWTCLRMCLPLKKYSKAGFFFLFWLTTLLHISHRIKSDTSTHQISHNEPIYSVRKFILYIINIIIVRE